jgi:hypothetical protein
MLTRPLQEKLNELQHEYLKLLKKLAGNLNSPDFLLVVDEVYIFWYSRRKLVTLILDNISANQECYVLMAASYLDVKDYEHFPFSCLGKVHLVDDTLCRYAGLYQRNVELSLEGIKEQIIFAMEDNIAVLENYAESIQILPISFIFDDNADLDLIRKASLQVISSMFRTEITTEGDFFKKFKSFLDIENGLSEDIKNQLIFTDYKDRALSFREKINRYLKENQSLLPNNLEESQTFFFMIFQYIGQAFDILMKCAQFNIVPYIRFDVSFQYLLTVSGNFTSQNQMQQIIFKSIVAHILYQVFEKERIQEVDYKEFSHALHTYDFNEKVSRELFLQDIDLDNSSKNKVAEILKQHLLNVY